MTVESDRILGLVWMCMPDLEFLVWRWRFRPIFLSKFKQPVQVTQPNISVQKLSRSIEVKPA